MQTLDELTRQATRFPSWQSLAAAMDRRHIPTLIVGPRDDEETATAKRALRRRLVELGYQVLAEVETR